MPELAAFQRDFAAKIDRPIPAPVPMRVYRNTILLGALEALMASYPVTRMIVGDEAFEMLALAFARRHPPEAPILALYGSQFPDWLARQPVARQLEYLALRTLRHSPPKLSRGLIPSSSSRSSCAPIRQPVLPGSQPRQWRSGLPTRARSWARLRQSGDPAVRSSPGPERPSPALNSIPPATVCSSACAWVKPLAPRRWR
jgi:Putative DNA-binding domain